MTLEAIDVTAKDADAFVKQVLRIKELVISLIIPVIAFTNTPQVIIIHYITKMSKEQLTLKVLDHQFFTFIFNI